MAKKAENNTMFFVVGGIILIVVLFIIFKKPKAYAYSRQRYGATGGGSGGGNTGGEGNAYLSYGDKGNKVKELQNYFNMTFGANLTVDGVWGNNTQNQINAYYTRKGEAPKRWINEADYKLISGRF